jgi:hypothetical protein
MIISNLKYNKMVQELKVLRVRDEVAGNILRHIAATPRNYGARRMASSAITFLDNCIKLPC